MLLLAIAALASAAPVETVSIPGSTVSFELAEIPESRTGRAFRIGLTEVTWNEYNLFADSANDEKIDGITRPSQPDVVNPRDPFRDGVVQTGDYPARSVGMYGALGYTAWLSKKTGRRFRLPTEREWLAAAGSIPAKNGWDRGNSGGHPRPVGRVLPNAAGLRDLLGNVAEICLEPYSPNGGPGVVRGGSWNTPAGRLSTSLREKIDLDAWLRDDPKRPVRDWWFTDAPFVGFRIVEPEPDPATTAERNAAIGRIVIANVKVAEPGTGPGWRARITGTLTYAAGDPVDEVELDACFADPDGKPLRTDPRGKPAYGLAWPVLASTTHRDGREKPFAAGQTRKFSVVIPVPFDEVGAVPVGSPVVKVTWVRFAR